MSQFLQIISIKTNNSFLNKQNQQLQRFRHKILAYQNFFESQQSDRIKIYIDQQFGRPIYYDIEQQVYQNCVSMVHGNYDIQKQIYIRWQSHEIKTNYFISKNCKIVILKSNKLNGLMSRHLANINSLQKMGGISLDSNTGIIKYYSSTTLNKRRFQMILNSEIELKKHINQLDKITTRLIKQNSEQILRKMGEDLKIYPKADNYHYKIQRKKSELQHKINKIMTITNQTYSFMHNQYIKPLKFPRDKQLKKSQNSKPMQQCTPQNFEFVSFVPACIINSEESTINSFFSKQHLNRQLISFNNQDIKQFVQTLRHTGIKQSIEYENLSVYSQIQICKKDSIIWTKINSGGFSQIERALVQFTYLDSVRKYVFKKLLVRKISNLNITHDKIQQEKKILQILKNSLCVNVSKFYTTKNQQSLNKDLFMEYYTFGSLTNYLTRFKKTSTLHTKIFILFQIAQGMRFLRDKKIIHLDLKPGNILVGKNFITRITDFGESYIQSFNLQQFKPGYSIPYVSPERFPNQQNKYFHEMDTFSFGIMMYEILFEQLPIQISYSGRKKLIDRYEANKYSLDIYMISPQKFNNLCGDQFLAQSILRLVLKCLDPEISKRPNFDWIVLLLRQLLRYLQLFF